MSSASTNVTPTSTIYTTYDHTTDGFSDICGFGKSKFMLIHQPIDGNKNINCIFPGFNIVVLENLKAADDIKIHGKSVILLHANLKTVSGSVQIKTEHRFIAIASTIESKLTPIITTSHPALVGLWKKNPEVDNTMNGVGLELVTGSSKHIRKRFDKGIKEEGPELILDGLAAMVHYVKTLLDDRTEVGLEDTAIFLDNLKFEEWEKSKPSISEALEYLDISVEPVSENTITDQKSNE